jgi:hypothetical protein
MCGRPREGTSTKRNGISGETPFGQARSVALIDLAVFFSRLLAASA